MVNKVRVNIAGTPYAIATTDPEKYIQSLAKKLDDDITKLLDNNGNLSVTKAAVFCAMDYLDEYRKSAGSAENMRSQIQDYIADAARAKLAEDKAKAENEVLRREAAALREQLEKMRSKEARREERAQQAAQHAVVGTEHPADPADDGTGRTGFIHDLGVDAFVHQHFGNVVALLHCAQLGIAAHIL